jgi:hypothetical protein
MAESVKQLQVTQTENSLERIASFASLEYNCEKARKRRYYDKREAEDKMWPLISTLGTNARKDDFRRIALEIRCDPSTVQRHHKKYIQQISNTLNSDSDPCSKEGQASAVTATVDDEPALSKRRNKLTAEEVSMLSAFMPTVGIHTKVTDCERIAQVVGCTLRTVSKYHQKFLAEMTASAASSALVAAGSSAPARAWVGGSGGAGAAPCGWSAPPAQVILAVVAAHPRLSRHTRSPLLAAPLPGGNGDFEKITPVAGSRPPGGRSAPPH